MINLKSYISVFLGAMLSLLSPPAFAQNVQEVPIDTARIPGEGPVRSLMLQKGYADTVSLGHYKNAAISEVQGTCGLVLADTQTVRFRCVSFKYVKGTGPDLPNQNKMPLNIRLYKAGITSDSLLSTFRWYINGTGTVFEDSAIHHPTTLILPPGSYRLSYGGYMANTAVADTTEILNINNDDGIGLSVQPGRTVIAPIGHSAVTLVLESLPLLQKIVKGWNAVTTYTSHDGTDENGDTLTACYDDFGRTSVSISRKMSPKGSDLVTVQQYDGFGRKARQWLPFTSAAGLTVDSLVKINRFPVGGADYPDKEPFTLTEYEPSPLSRPTVEYDAGADWHSRGKGIRSSYLVNISGNDTLGCRNLTITYPGGRAQVQSSGEYATGTLQVLCTKDEDGNKQFTFSDRSNRTVLVRRMLHEGGLQKALDTYYLYDGFDNLLAVLPPAASAVLKGGSVEWTALYKYAILYHYDNRDRLKAKKLPGCGWTSFVYDENDRLVLTQTAELKKQGRALFTLCDSLGRVCISGTCSFSLAPGYSIPAGTCCHYEGKSGTLAGYTATGITLINAKVMTASYYDNYNFLNDLCNRSVLPKASLLYGHEAEFCSGLQTGGMQAVLDPANAGNTKCLYTVTKYDYRARPSRAETENLTGGYDTEDTEYDFLGRVTRRHLTHYVPAPKVNLSEDYTYHYDRAGRVLTVSHSVNSGKAHTLTANQYDEPGRLSRRTAEGNGRLAVSYNYNVRSWPTRIASPVFEERLSYNQAQGTTQPRFNGNISSLEWRVRYSDATHKDGKARIYNFSYDNLNRLTEADYQEARETNHHYTTHYEYDVMGNLLNLRRNGLHNNGTYKETDNMSCTYNGNQLVKADDSATDPVYKDCFTFRDGADEEVEYEYDENGNLTKDLNRGICKIQYNVLNLPSRVDFRDGSHITYIYNGGGHKLRTDYYINTLTIIMPLPILYTGTAGRRNLVHTWTTNCSNLVLENDTLKMSLFDGGYVSYPQQKTPLDPTYGSDKKPAWHYYLKDHLGSNRVVMSASGTPEQINHYYPYGGLMGESQNITSSQRYSCQPVRYS